MTRLPCCSVYRLDITISRSLVCFTGRNLQEKYYTDSLPGVPGYSYLDLGTLIPEAASKHFIAAPTAVSSW